VKARKYHRTYHLPWSLGATSDDKMVSNDSHFVGKNVVVTEKMDGENTSLYRNTMHARSLDSRHHASRDWVKQFWSKIAWMIPEGMVIRGENLFAKHSILYESLPSYFLGFSAEDENGTVLSWNDTIGVFEKLGIVPVPVLYIGEYNREQIEQITASAFGDYSKNEGYVIRLADEYNVSNSKTSINKFVRPNHVQTSTHWTKGEVIPNKLK